MKNTVKKITQVLESYFFQIIGWMETAIKTMTPIHNSIEDLTHTHDCFSNESEMQMKTEKQKLAM